MLLGRSFAARLVSTVMPDTRTTELIYSTLRYFSIYLQNSYFFWRARQDSNLRPMD
jgi:hypothetical protein